MKCHLAKKMNKEALGTSTQCSPVKSLHEAPPPLIQFNTPLRGAGEGWGGGG